MKDYLEKRREELRKQGGFTLMEMLIVVAIIAVLIAIAIPVFTSQLEKSRDATSVANMRSAYAQAQAAYLVEDDSDANVTFTRDTTSKQINTISVANVRIESAQANDWSNEAKSLPFKDHIPNDDGVAGDYTLTFTYDNAGTITDAALATTPANP